MNSEPETPKSSRHFNETATHLIPTKEITWTVPDLESLPEDAGYTVDSPLFFFQNAVWCLRLYPNREYKNIRATFIGLCIVRLSSHVPHHRLQYHFESEDIEETFCGEAADFDENHKENGNMSFIPRYTEHPMIENNIFRVTCRISCYGTHVEDVFSQTRSLNGAQKNSKPEMIKSDEDFNQTETHLIPTKEITWTVPDFKSLPKDSGFSLDSPPFVFQKATWCLRLYPHQIEYGDIYVALYIVRLSSYVPHHRLQYHFTSLDNESNYCGVDADFDESNKTHGNVMFSHDPFIQKNIFRIICQISRYGSRDEDDLPRIQHFQQDMKDLGDLSQHFKSLLQDGQNRDVVIKVKDKEFRAHQDILRARSPVLGSMLSHDMIEKNSGVIDIPDCDPDAFEQFLLYIYCGKVETLDSNNMLSVYYIADKYDMGHLKEICHKFIKDSLTCANVSDVIQLAWNHSDTDLLKCATEYFKKNVPSVLRTVEWQRFLKHNPDQANELLIKAADRLHMLE